MNYRFIDLDYFFEEKFRISVAEFFKKYEEEAFRRIESDLIQKSKDFTNVVISTGGGAPCFYNNMELMNESGITIYIKMTAAALRSRLIVAKKDRPLIADVPEHELEEFILTSLKRREPFYNRAKLTIDGLDFDINQIAELIYMNPSL